MLLHPFVIGNEYRRPTLLEFMGSKQQMSGVLWGTRQPGLLICTSGGRHGKKAGYLDEALDDGSWWYFGQGKQGDQSIKNPANARLAAGGMAVLLFTTREPTASEIAMRGGYWKIMRFEGGFNIAGYELYTPVEGPRKGNQLLRFKLIRTDGEEANIGEVGETGETSSLKSLRQKLDAYDNISTGKSLTTKEYWKRSREVRLYALLRAEGVCEGCGKEAPFKDLQNRPFLEVHHIQRLSDSGPDKPGNVAAICPNCHRRAHLSLERETFRKSLEESVRIAEEKLA